MNLTLTNVQAIDVLNRLDRADENSVLLYVIDGLKNLLQANSMMDILKVADDNIEDVIIKDVIFYYEVMNRLHQWETKTFGPMVVPDEECGN